MTLLLSTSKYISIPILTEWLTIFDFVLFDVALSNHVMSRKLIALCFDYPKLFEQMLSEETIVYSPKFMNWMSKLKLSSSVVLKSDKLQMIFDNSSTLGKVGRSVGLLKRNEYVSQLKLDLSKIEDLTIVHEVMFLESFIIAMAIVLKKAVKLKSLTIRYNGFTMLGLTTNIMNLPLQKVDLPWGSVASTLIRSLPHLIELKVTSKRKECMYHHDWILTMIVWCRQLKRLDIVCSDRQWCMLAFHAGTMFDGFKVTDMKESVLKTFLWHRCNESLTRLTFDTEFNFNTLRLNLFPVIPNLTDLSMSFGKHIVDDGFNSMKQLPKLQSLSVQCQALCLRSPKVSFVNEYPVINLTLYAPFPECWNINGVCSSLTTLYIDSIFPIDRAITDDCLRVFGQYCPMLTHLTLRKCFKQTEEGLRTILEHGRITYLYVEECALTISAIHSIAKYCCHNL